MLARRYRRSSTRCDVCSRRRKDLVGSLNVGAAVCLAVSSDRLFVYSGVLVSIRRLVHDLLLRNASSKPSSAVTSQLDSPRSSIAVSSTHTLLLRRYTSTPRTPLQCFTVDTSYSSPSLLTCAPLASHRLFTSESATASGEAKRTLETGM